MLTFRSDSSPTPDCPKRKQIRAKLSLQTAATERAPQLRFGGDCVATALSLNRQTVTCCFLYGVDMMLSKVDTACGGV